MEEVIIIGAGLSGLATAYNLKKENIPFKIMEAQHRVGGRIETIYGTHTTPMEMGATWFGKEHVNLAKLLAEINVGYFEQHTEGIALFETMSFEPPQQYYVPANSHSAYRVKGGTYSIIDQLYQIIGKENVSLNTHIKTIIDEDNNIKLTDSDNNHYYCKNLIIALPPNLGFNTIQFTPELPPQLSHVMQKTQTWMSGSIKFSVEYSQPFWREKGFSGSIYSQSSLAPEIYDHCNFEETKYALKGFLNGSAVHYSFEERKEKVIAQLKKYFGNEAEQYESYHDKIWNDRYTQQISDDFLSPHLNNGHPLYQESYMDGKLFFTGTETSKSFGGYMEGAVIASNAVVDRLLKKIKIEGI
jgi:monoamine oxidase